MKKALALIACLMIFTTCCVPAFAADHPSFKPTLVSYLRKEMDDTPREFVSTLTNVRPVTLALFLLDYLTSGETIAGTGDLEDYSFSKSYYICKYGSLTIDMYFPLSDGGYLNLFYGVGTGSSDDEVIIYGKTTSTSFKYSDEHTYHAVDASDVFEEMLNIVKGITD